MVFGVQVVHGSVKLIQVFVSQKLVVGKVELSSSIVERVAVAFAGKVEPFWMAKLVAFEIQVAFSAQRMHEQPV